MFRSKGAIRALSVLYRVFCVFCVLWTLFFLYFIYFCLFLDATEGEYAGFIIGFGVVCVLVGLAGILVLVQEMRLLRRMKRLQIILSPVEDTPVSVIAREWGVSLNDAEKTLKKMIYRKHLRKVRMDMRNHQVVPMDKPYGGRVSEQQMERTPSAMIDVICRNCGATNRVLQGEAAKCAYCNSVLRAR